MLSAHVMSQPAKNSMYALLASGNKYPDIVHMAAHSGRWAPNPQGKAPSQEF